MFSTTASPRWVSFATSLGLFFLLMFLGIQLFVPAHADAPAPPVLMNAPALAVQGDPVQQASKLLPESTHPVSKTIIVAEDTFVADRYPYNDYLFYNEQVLAFGTDSTLGNMRTFLRLEGALHPGAQVVRVYLALGIAGGSNDDAMPVEIGESKVAVNMWNLRWNNQPTDAQVDTWFRTDIITRGLWYIYDVTSHFLNPEHPNQLREKVIRIRALQEPAPGWKGMWSREGNSALAPRLIVFYYPDRTPPTCTMRPLPDTLYKPSLLLRWSCQDNSQAQTMRIILQRRVDNGPWQKIMDRHTYRTSLLNLWELKAYRGHRLSFRVRAVDDRGNVGDWSDPVSTTVNNVPPRIIRADFSPYQWHIFKVYVDYPAPPGEGWINLYDLKGRVENAGLAIPIYANTTYSSDKTFVASIPRMPESLFGHWVRYRFRLGDLLENMSEEFEVGPIFVYKFHGRVHVRDILDRPLRARLSLSPEALVHPDGDTIYDVYAWQSRQVDVTLSSGGFRFLTVPLQFPPFSGSMPISRTFTLHVGVGDNAVENGNFSNGLEKWTTYGNDVFTKNGRFRGGIFRLPSSSDPALIVPTMDHDLLLWYHRTVAKLGPRGTTTTVLEVPDLPNQQWWYWMVPPGQSKTVYALASVQHVSQTTTSWSWNLLRWDRETGDARFVTSTVVSNGPLWKSWQDLDVDEDGRPAVLWWNEQEEPHLIYQVLEGDRWYTHAITSSISSPTRLRLLITRSGVWAFVIKDETLCWYHSPDGHQWEDEVCRNYHPYKLFRAGRLGPFTYNGRVLRLLDPTGWHFVASAPNTNLTGCPDETIRGIQGQAGFLYAVGWNASGQALLSQKLVSTKELLYLTWPSRPMWCDGTSYGFDFSWEGEYRLARIWLQPHLVPLLSQSVNIPGEHPVFALQGRLESAQEATVYATFVPQEGNGAVPLTVTLPITGSMSYHAVDLSPLAGQKVSLTFAISSTVYPMIGALKMDGIRIKSVPYEVAVAQRATWLDDRRVLLDVWAYNHRQMPALNVMMGMSWPESMSPLHLPEDITLTQGTQVTIPLGTVEAEATRHLTATFALSGTRPMTAAFRAWISPRTADINPKNNESLTILFGREVKRRYFPQVIHP